MVAWSPRATRSTRNGVRPCRSLAPGPGTGGPLAARRGHFAIRLVHESRKPGRWRGAYSSAITASLSIVPGRIEQGGAADGDNAGHGFVSGAGDAASAFDAGTPSSVRSSSRGSVQLMVRAPGLAARGFRPTIGLRTDALVLDQKLRITACSLRTSSRIGAGCCPSRSRMRFCTVGCSPDGPVASLSRPRAPNGSTSFGVVSEHRFDPQVARVHQGFRPRPTTVVPHGRGVPATKTTRMKAQIETERTWPQRGPSAA